MPQTIKRIPQAPLRQFHPKATKPMQKPLRTKPFMCLPNADGSVKKIIVSDWIKNGLNEKSLKDKTDLQDVKNAQG